MSTKLRMSVLDFCRVVDGTSDTDTIWNALELARRVDKMGFDRYWVAEHHEANVAHISPIPFITSLAGSTRRLRVGTAGVLLRYHNPYRIAGDFRFLETLFPGRLDLGLARGFVDPAFEKCLIPEGAQPDYEKSVELVLAFLRGQGAIAVRPINVAMPEVWVLGSNRTSMQLAAEQGTAYCLSLFLRQDTDFLAVAREYRARFKPSIDLPAPRLAIAIAGAWGRTTQEAELCVQAFGTAVRPRAIGPIGVWLETIERLRSEFQTDEVVVLEMSGSLDDRTRGYEKLAEGFSL